MHKWNDNHGEDKLYEPNKFRVFKGWKEPLEEIGTDGEFFFVLRPERDKAAVDALYTYASEVEYRSPNLASELRNKLADIQNKNEVL